MIEVGILKNFDSGTYKAGIQLAGSLTTYFDDINVAKNIPSSAMVTGNYVIVAIPGGNPRDACVIATWPQGSPGGGAGSFLNLSDTPSSYSGQAGKYVKVNAAANALAFGLIATKFTPVSVDYMFRRDTGEDSSFVAQINGTPTATSVVYDSDSREMSLPDYPHAPNQWGKVILHNITRGNSRKITGFDPDTDTITTEESNDDWADNDIITTGSRTCVFVPAGHTYSQFFDIDISAEVPATATGVLLLTNNRNLSGTATGALQDSLALHPYQSYVVGKTQVQRCMAAYDDTAVSRVITVNDRKICMASGFYGAVTASRMLALARLLAYWE